jgi:hypothetical protein
LSGGHIVSLKKVFNNGLAFKDKSPQEIWVLINEWVKGKSGKKDSPTVEEVASYFDITATEPEKVEAGESSDISSEYNVKRGCALQALINFQGTVLDQDSAEALHDHIWATEDLAAYKNYDVDWEKLYAHVGITMTTEHAGKKASALPYGKFICEVAGHMMVVTSSKKGGTVLIQDPANAIGKLTDVIKQSYP